MEPKELREKFIGSMIVTVTPFKDDYSLDLEGLSKNAKFLIDSGVHVLMPTASTGEAFSLTREETIEVIKATVKSAKGKVPVVAGTSASSTQQTIDLSKRAQDAGADGVMVSPPFFTPKDEVIYEHYKALAESIDIGIVIYNSPKMCKSIVGPKLMKRLAEINGIAGVKGDTGILKTEFLLMQAVGDKLSYICGGAEFLSPQFLMGGKCKGIITGMGNFVPKISVDMYNYAMKKDWNGVVKLWSKTVPYNDLAFNYLSEGLELSTTVKASMEILGMPAGPSRKPLKPLNKGQKEKLKGVIKGRGLLT